MVDAELVRLVAVKPKARVDWFRVVVMLERSGLTQQEIADGMERSKTQVAAYKSIPGTEPPFHSAMLLLGLWAERCSRPGDPPPFLK